jgi:hypothetical protein
VEINAMAIGKIRIGSTNDTPDIQSKGRKPRAEGCIPEAAPTGEEGLRLIQASCKITDRSERWLIDAAESFERAGGPR